MRIATTPMQIPKPTLRQIPEQPFSSEEEILKAIISFYTIQNIHQQDDATYYYGTYSYVYDGTYSFRDSYPNYFLYPAKSFLNQIRVFFNSGSMFEKKEYSEEHSYSWNKKIDVKDLAYSYKQFYKDNKNSDSAVEKLTKDVIMPNILSWA